MWYPDPAAARLRHDRQMRMLYACLGVSIALHSLAMLGLPSGRPAFRPNELPELTALLASQPEAAPAPAAMKPHPRHEVEIPTPLPKTPEPAPAAEPSLTEPTPARAAAPAETHAVASAPAPVQSEAPAKPAQVLDPSLFDAYRLALIDAAKRNKDYPRQAIDRGWEGRVEIRVVVDANGTIKSAAVKTSSRYQVLDNQALEMVKKALAQMQPAPRGQEFTVDVPVVFELQTG